jgi:hypothetical protein
MNRSLTELAQLQLHKNPAWCELHLNCFHEIFAPGTDELLAAVWMRYQKWCLHRQIPASQSELRRQLAKAGYKLNGETVCGVQLRAAIPRFDDELNVRQAVRLLGIDAGLLKALREFGGGPVFWRDGREILYNRSGLLQWRERLRRRQTAWDAIMQQRLFRCLEELCRFSAIEAHHVDRSEELQERSMHPRLLNPSDWSTDRVTESALLAAMKDWYERDPRGGGVAWGLREMLHAFLPMLNCRRKRAQSNRKRYFEWRGVWLRSSETAAETQAAERLRAKSGLKITVASVLDRHN